MSPELEMAQKLPHQYDGEIEIFIEFPKTFDGDKEFLSFTGESGVNGFYRNDPVAVEFLTGAVSGNVVSPPQGFPGDAADETKEAFEVFSGEIRGEADCLRQSDVERRLLHHQITTEQLNPILQSALAVLARLTENYGSDCRLVFWLHDA